MTKTIGIIVAEEMKAVFRAMGEPDNSYRKCGFKVYEYKYNGQNIVIVESGAGEIAASAGTQFLISTFEPDMILNFGVAGGLVDNMPVMKPCVVKDVTHYQYDISQGGESPVGKYMFEKERKIPTDEKLLAHVLKVIPDLEVVSCASADKFVLHRDEREALARDFDCQICEMEAAGIILTARRNKVPVVMIKAISDGVSDHMDEFLFNFEDAADQCFEVLKKCFFEHIIDDV